MVSFVLRMLIIACAIQFALPIVPGVHFTGVFFPDAILYAFLFTVVSILVDIGLALFAVALTGATAGLAALILIPVFVLGWWIVPALQLELLAHWFPHHFAIDGFGSAVLAGLIMLVINFVTRAISGKRTTSGTGTGTGS